MTADPLAVVRRGARIAVALTPLVAELLATGADSVRRERLGTRLRTTSEDLGGVFPWFARLLAEAPAVAGPALARGIGTVSAPERRGPFHRLIPFDRSPGTYEINSGGDPAVVETDLRTLRIILRVLAPLTGRLSPALVDASVALVAEQVAAEASVEEEERHRARLRPSEVVVATTMTRRASRVVEIVPAPFHEPPTRDEPTLQAILAAWCALVSDAELLVPAITWDNCRRVDGDGPVVVQRLAGAVHAPVAHRHVIALLDGGAPPDEARHAFARLLADEFGAPEHAVGPLVDTVTALAYGERQAGMLGPLALLRELDAVMRASPSAPQLTRPTFLLVRQLAAFCTMADDVGSGTRLFAAERPR